MLAGSLYVGVLRVLMLVSRWREPPLTLTAVVRLVPEQACWRAACSWACTWR